jgi:predicted lysophospholipase L1 biosynthesis ABC-type transport system permease subunit
MLALGLVAGLVGGAILGALAGARRTSTACGRLARAAGSAQEVLFVFDQSKAIETWLASAPGVDHYAAAAGMIGRRSPQEDWYSVYAPYKTHLFPRPVLVRGRLPRINRADEVFITVRTAHNTGLDVGDEVNFRAYDARQTNELLQNPWTVPSGAPVSVKVVGIARDPSDAQLSQTIKLLFGTPAFARAQSTRPTFILLLVWLKGGQSAEPAFERDLTAFARTLPSDGAPFNIVPSRDDAAAADHSSSAVVTGLLIFAVVAAIAGLVTIVQIVRRNFAQAYDETDVLAALGAPRNERALAQFIASVPSLTVAAAMAVAFAYALSPLFPIGATRALEPKPGLHADPLVLLGGAVAWLALLCVLTFAVVWLDAARRPGPARAGRESVLGRFISGANGRPTAVGALFALQPAARRTALHRSALAGVVIAVAGVVSCLVFTRSVDNFTQTPARYGIGFDISIELPNHGARAVLHQLAADRDLAAVAASHSGTIDIDGRQVEAYGVEPIIGTTIRPTLRSGSLPAHDDEIAIGPKLLAGLHKRIGDRVTIGSGAASRDVRIVGTVLSPVSESNAFNAEALLTPRAVDADTGFPSIGALVVTRPGADVARVLANLDRRYPYGISDESRAHAPGPVRNLEQITRLPLALAMFFALLGAAAFAQLIFMLARERRRDLAVLRVMGYRRAQTRGVLCSAAVSIAVVGLVIGIPLGLLAGRFGWHIVADGLAVSPSAAIPVGAVAALGVALVAFASTVAMAPAHLVLRRTPGAALRAE